ncbi:MAG: MATE family efflux transporter [Clostridium sp.]|nr:MATE family efflux transporter [Clostridium sp.]
MLKKINFQDEFYQKLRALVLPITVQHFMLALVSATDAVMLGAVNQTSLSAVSLAGQVQFVLSLFVSGIAIGSGIMAAQYWGKEDAASIEKVMPIALRANLIFSGLFTIAAAAAPELLMRIFTNDTALIASGALYLRAVALSYLLCGISQVYLILLKNTGYAAISSRISSTAVALNVVLNGILIFGLLGFPALGIQGAAYATVCARLVELVWSYLETKQPGRVRILWGGMFRAADEILRGDFWRYTTPVLGASLVWGIAYVSYSVIMGHMGSDAVAANSITSIAKSLLSCLIRGVSGGAGVLIGNLLGAGELAKAKEYGGRLTRMAIVVGIATGGLLMLISPIIVRLAPLSETAAHYLQYMLLFCGCNIMAQSVNTTVLDGIFCAGGDSKFDMVGNIGAMWCFSVPLGFLSAFVFGLPVMAVYCIVNLDEIVKLWAVYLHYKKYIWVRNITREE